MQEIATIDLVRGEYTIGPSVSRSDVCQALGNIALGSNGRTKPIPDLQDTRTTNGETAPEVADDKRDLEEVPGTLDQQLVFRSPDGNPCEDFCTTAAA